ncbi:MAG: hypothetical protein EHM21_14840, partial [Chloroflexi bacterium]
MRNLCLTRTGIFRIAFAGLLLIFIGSACTQSRVWVAAQDVLQFRGPDKNSIYQATDFNPAALSGGAKISWQAALGNGYSAVTIRLGRLYTMGNAGRQDTVWCLSADNGSVIWKYSYDCRNNEYPGPRATPTLDGEMVYTLSSEGHLFCLKATDGSVVWSKNLVRDFGAEAPNWTFAGSVVIDGDLLLLNANKNGIVLNKKTGATVWSSKAGRGGYSTPVVFTVGKTRAMALFGEETLLGVEIATGRVLWEYPWSTAYQVNAADPLVIGNTIFVTSGYSTGCAMFQFTESSIVKKWENDRMSAHFGSPVAYAGMIWGMDGNSGSSSAFQALDPATGESRVRESMRFG